MYMCSIIYYIYQKRRMILYAIFDLLNRRRKEINQKLSCGIKKEEAGTSSTADRLKRAASRN